MTKTLYTAEATVTGGRAEGHGVTSDGALDVQLRAPVEMGGEGGGTNPELPLLERHPREHRRPHHGERPGARHRVSGHPFVMMRGGERAGSIIVIDVWRLIDRSSGEPSDEDGRGA